MKIIHRITFLVCIMFPSLATMSGESDSYRVDRYVQQNEQAILERFGKPNSIVTLPAKELVDAVRAPIRKKHFAFRPNVQVRELYYNTRKGETIFWLTEKSGKWVVVADIWIAPGVQF